MKLHCFTIQTNSNVHFSNDLAFIFQQGNLIIIQQKKEIERH